MKNQKTTEIKRDFKALNKLNPSEISVKISNGEMNMTNYGGVEIQSSDKRYKVMAYNNQIAVKYNDDKSNTGIIIVPDGMTLRDDTEHPDIERKANAIQADYHRIILAFESVIVLYNSYSQTLQVDFGN